ncbi:MAG: caspase family protein [Lewinellaceae bacterium]|nr:caspase family protein [Lewinellaceae bacterium]
MLGLQLPQLAQKPGLRIAVPTFAGARGDAGSGPKLFDCSSIKPSLYLLMIGTSKYSDASKNLTYPDLDASEMAKALSSTGKVLFEDRVHVKLLSTAGEGVEISSKANIEKAFLEFKKATPCDVLVVYFSGHEAPTWGKEATNQTFTTSRKTSPAPNSPTMPCARNMPFRTKSSDQVACRYSRSKTSAHPDARNPGKAAENLRGIGQRDLNSSQVIAFELLKDRTGTFILTGSASDMVSFEASQYGQGLLTYSLLEGISGTALEDGKYVDIMKLFQNARDVVPKLAASIKQVQSLSSRSLKAVRVFPSGSKMPAKINLPQPVPVVIQCNFQDRDNFNDGLGLVAGIERLFP